jgi:hypothetical protein
MHIFSKDVLEKEKKKIEKGEQEHQTLCKKLTRAYRGEERGKEEQEQREQEKKEGETQHAHLLKECVREGKRENREGG